MPPGGLNIRLGDTVLGQEARLHDFKRDAMLAFVRANKLNRMICSGGRNAARSASSPSASAISTSARRSTSSASTRSNATTSACASTRSAVLADRAAATCMEFAAGPRAHHRGRGKALADRGARSAKSSTAPPTSRSASARRTSSGDWLFPVKGALDPNDVAHLHRRAAARLRRNDELAARVARLKEAPARARRDRGRRGAHAVFLLGLPAQHLDHGAGRQPRLCRHRLPLHGAVDGPRHTELHPDGRRGRALDRRRRRSPRRSTSSQISATAPTTIRASLAIRAAIAAGVNITYKILFNDAVAMTGGQPSTAASRCRRSPARSRPKASSAIVVVTDEPEKYPAVTDFAARRRRSITATTSTEVQRELREVPGRHRADLRPDLRRREAPPPQARPVPRPGQARRHQRAGLRRLRRLLGEVELRVGASRWRPSSAASARSTSRPATRTSPA